MRFCVASHPLHLYHSGSLFARQTVLIKQCEKLEVTVHELNVKIEEINRTVIDLTSIKTRLSQVSSNTPVMCIGTQVSMHDRLFVFRFAGD